MQKPIGFPILFWVVQKLWNVKVQLEKLFPYRVQITQASTTCHESCLFCEKYTLTYDFIVFHVLAIREIPRVVCLKIFPFSCRHSWQRKCWNIKLFYSATQWVWGWGKHAMSITCLSPYFYYLRPKLWCIFCCSYHKWFMYIAFSLKIDLLGYPELHIQADVSFVWGLAVALACSSHCPGLF